MKITGIIAEYNPFHNGHRYHLEETRRIMNADYIIAVISGDFVQRGAPAIADKYLRTEAALSNGADLVLELPLFYAAGSAEYFAAGAVTLLDKLGCVDALCFGSECGSLRQLSAIASILAKEPESYRIILQKELKSGCSFPKARRLALEALAPEFCSADSGCIQSLISSPNNILSIEYIKILLKRNSPIVPYTIKRKGNSYHDTALPFAAPSLDSTSSLDFTPPTDSTPSLDSTQPTDSTPSTENPANPVTGEAFGSASAIRSVLTAEEDLSQIRPYVPDSVYPLLENALDHGFPIHSDDFSSLLYYKLMQEASGSFRYYLDITDDLSDKICRNLFRFTSYESFCSLLKSKDITYSRLSRGLLHILLNMTKAQMEKYVQNDYIAYARILGFRQTASPLLKTLKANAAIPIISRLADAKRRLTPTGLSMLEQDIQAAHIYRYVAADKYHIPFVHEYARRPVIG